MNLQPYERYEIEAKLQGRGFSKVDATLAVDQWTSPLPATFKFKTAFPSSDAHCASSWGTRVFKHIDWKDGVNLVQAEQTPNEEGFNNRFHDIENDLDRLGDSVDTAFDCINNLRASLAQILNEISAQFDVIAAVIASCCKAQPAAPTVTATIDTGKVIGSISLDKYTEVVVVAAEDGHIVLLPKGQGGPPRPGGGVYDPMVSRAADLMRILTAHPEIAAAIHGGVTKESVVKDFGNVTVDGGPELHDVVDVLPSSVTFGSIDAMVTALAETESATEKATHGTDFALASAFDRPVADVSKMSIETFSALAPEARSALAEGGLRTVGELADASPDTVSAALEAAGVGTEAGEAGAMIGAAKVMGFFA